MSKLNLIATVNGHLIPSIQSNESDVLIFLKMQYVRRNSPKHKNSHKILYTNESTPIFKS